MSEEETPQEEAMKLVFGDLGNGGSVVVELEKPVAVHTGTGTYGEWQLWAGSVENTTVHKGKGTDDELVMGYTGRVIFFPSEKLIPQLETASAGNDSVKVKVTKGQKTSMGGKKYTVYEVEKMSEGKPSDSSVSPMEQLLIDTAQELVDAEYDITKDLFIKSSQEPQYENKITVERADELYAILVR